MDSGRSASASRFLSAGDKYLQAALVIEAIGPLWLLKPLPRPSRRDRIFKKRPSAQHLVRALISLKSRDAMKENLDSRAGSEFDIEIERAMTQSSHETHETDLDLHLDSGLRN
ncbi:uncharacterized protein N7525_007386 [Penicillium rubens]|uniref:uncharacterized protein n=1 Tax=Penicillium rubens TaxID=1108849 RepID=UPI002391A767|nr:uncharacterized protein N7525_007386 [Penicillium rubens]KAJ5265197.1 hypothetical protein N7524_006215 [Penicillium chrysogenum]KAJ5829133.1 hypothetical protein N7525_007386 [Penicillium rubens]